MIFMNIMFMLVIVSVFTVIRFASSIRQEKKECKKYDGTDCCF